MYIYSTYCGFGSSRWLVKLSDVRGKREFFKTYSCVTSALSLVCTCTLGGGNLLFLCKRVLFPFIASREFHEMFSFWCFSRRLIRRSHFKNVKFNLNANRMFFLVTKPVSSLDSFFFILFPNYSVIVIRNVVGSKPKSVSWSVNKVKIASRTAGVNFRQGCVYFPS